MSRTAPKQNPVSELPTTHLAYELGARTVVAAVQMGATGVGLAGFAGKYTVDAVKLYGPSVCDAVASGAQIVADHVTENAPTVYNWLGKVSSTAIDITCAGFGVAKSAITSAATAPAPKVVEVIELRDIPKMTKDGWELVEDLKNSDEEEEDEAVSEFKVELDEQVIASSVESGITMRSDDENMGSDDEFILTMKPVAMRCNTPGPNNDAEYCGTELTGNVSDDNAE